MAEYIDQQFEQYFRDESGLNRKNIQDNRVHCCLYFISPFGHGYGPSLRLLTTLGAAEGTGQEHQGQGCHKQVVTDSCSPGSGHWMLNS